MNRRDQRIQKGGSGEECDQGGVGSEHQLLATSGKDPSFVGPAAYIIRRALFKTKRAPPWALL